MMYIAADDMLANFAVQSLRQLKRSARSDVVDPTQPDDVVRYPLNDPNQNWQRHSGCKPMPLHYQTGIGRHGPFEGVDLDNPLSQLDGR